MFFITFCFILFDIFFILFTQTKVPLINNKQLANLNTIIKLKNLNIANNSQQNTMHNLQLIKRAIEEKDQLNKQCPKEMMFDLNKKTCIS